MSVGRLGNVISLLLLHSSTRNQNENMFFNSITMLKANSTGRAKRMRSPPKRNHRLQSGLRKNWPFHSTARRTAKVSKNEKGRFVLSCHPGG